MNTTGKTVKKQAAKENLAKKGISEKVLEGIIAEIRSGLKASTWRDLETKGKFNKNDKLDFISDDTLIVGCDIGSETHYARAIDNRGRELTTKPFEFSNDSVGFESVKEWALRVAAENDKKLLLIR